MPMPTPPRGVSRLVVVAHEAIALVDVASPVLAMSGDEMPAADLAFDAAARAHVSGPVAMPEAIIYLELDLGGRRYQHDIAYLARHSQGWLLTMDAAEALAFLGTQSGLVGTVHCTSDNAVAVATTRAINGACRCWIAAT